MLSCLKRPHCADPRAWVESRLKFSLRTSPSRPGMVSLERQPWMTEILECFLDDQLEDLHLVMGTQVGKTTVCVLGMSLLLEYDPLPLIWALPTDEIASRLVRTRLLPFLLDNHLKTSLIERLPSMARPRELPLDGMDVFVTGVGAPGKLASIPAAYVICDEEAKFEHRNRQEAHPVELLAERTKSFPRKLRVHASTPNVEEHIFWRGFTQTDQRKFFVPCPSCGQMQSLEFTKESLVWDKFDKEKEGSYLDQVEASARYVCCACKAQIADYEKYEMLAAGQWRATNKKAARSRRGYWLNSLYSPYVSWGEFAREFCRCQADEFPQEAYQNFANSWEARPYVRYSVNVKSAAVAALMRNYGRGELPVDDYYYLITTYDPGQDRTHWVTTLVALRGAMYVIDWGTVLGVKGDESREQLGLAEHVWGLRYQDKVVDLGYVDSGDWTMDVYDECERSCGVLTPTKGSGADYGTWSKAPLKARPALDLITYRDYLVKSELYGEIIGNQRGGELYLPRDADAELIDGLSGQTLETKSGGKRVWKDLRNDHYGDCVKLARVSWWAMRAQLEPVTPVEE